MIDIDEWLKCFVERAERTFADRIEFIGIQGSYARGEAKDTSDIDIVVIFDELTPADLRDYRDMLDTLPEREKICGFVSGRNELMNWEVADLFQFCHDTTPIKGSLDEVLARVDAEAVKRAVKSGACNIYHACVHNFLHERDANILAGLYKSAAFVIQAKYFLETGNYVRKHSELCGQVSPEDREILLREALDFDGKSLKLFTWAGRIIQSS